MAKTAAMPTHKYSILFLMAGLRAKVLFLLTARCARCQRKTRLKHCLPHGGYFNTIRPQKYGMVQFRVTRDA